MNLKNMRIFKMGASAGLILVLSITASAQFNGLGCPAKAWNLNTISRFARTSYGSDGTQRMVCAHRGVHDWLSDQPNIPENSANAVKLAFDQFPCVEVDVGMLANGNVGLYHDRRTYRSTRTFIGQEGNLNNSGDFILVIDPQLNEMIPDYSVQPQTNRQYIAVKSAQLRPMRQNTTIPSPINLYLLKDLLSDMKACSNTTGLVVLDVRDDQTLLHIADLLRTSYAESQLSSQLGLPTLDLRHIIVKFKPWKLVGTHNNLHYFSSSKFLNVISELSAIGVVIEPTIIQGPDLTKDLGAVLESETPITTTIIKACAFYTQCPMEVSIPQGSSDPLNTVLLPNNLSYSATTTPVYEGYAQYLAAWNTSRSQGGTPSQIWGWIPVPEVSQSIPIPDVSDTPLPANLYYQANGLLNGYFNFATGTCCRIASTQFTAELASRYVLDTIGARVITIDGPLAGKYGATAAEVDQTFFTQAH